MKFAKRVFLIAAIYGLIALLPQYFLEAKSSHDFPPPITHPEYYYGFLGVAAAWQLAFLVIARDPVRYRLLMLPAIVEKASFGIAVMVLYGLHRVSPPMVPFAALDLFLGVLFFLSYQKTAANSPN